MQNDKLTELISRHLSGEASEEELEQLHAHLANHPQDQYFFDILSNYWQSHGSDITPDDSAASGNHFNQLMEKALREEQEAHTITRRPPIHLMSKRWLQYAAVVVLVIGPTYWLWHSSSKTAITNSPKKNEITAHKGARSKLRLPDGTTVWLNSDSKLTYSDHFNGPVREVELTGEGFFDVVKDPQHPFIVHTSGIDIRVLGTAFNVKSYPQSNTIEATLIRGLIEVARKDSPDGPKVYLHPHEKLVYRKEDSTFSASTDKPHTAAASATETNMAISSVPRDQPDSTLPETAWVYNKLMFNGESFQEMADKMERWFNVKMVLEDEKVANYRFRVIFENETIEQALQALQLTASFNYKINQNNEVHIYKTR